MSAADIADARNLLRNAAIRATIAQTAKSMAKGGMATVIIAGTLSSLEIGLQYAGGKITWKEMIEEISKRTLLAGGASFVITGSIVGLSLAFPFLIPVITPVLFVLQIVALIFLAEYFARLAKGWLDFLNDQGLLDGLDGVLGKAESALNKMLDSVTGDAPSFVRKSVDQTSQHFGIERARHMLVDLFQQMGVGVEEARTWIAARIPSRGEKPTSIVSLRKQGNFDTSELNLGVTDIRESIARVVSSEFEGASSTANAMRRSISEYRKSANLEGGNLPLAVS